MSKKGATGKYRSVINTKPVTIYPDAVRQAQASPSTSAPPQSDTNKDKNAKEMKASEEQSAHPRPDISAAKTNQHKKDLMISYSHADKEMMLKIRDNLEKFGISVWVDVSGLSAGVDFLSKIGEAIIDCKLFLSLLSANSVKSKFCQDELALAYVSDRAIFPVAMQSRKDLLPLMDTGM
ncbi:tir domain protein [Plakobranchus ocellatus]|uniref:Tir domain protein n=1 Tax=Plakobranchus ocellatus TaxID=259542 RepID=A0AAV3Y5U1_9GAST|nr:tir domain protein [Plakobranchus ocellatus]